MYTEQCREVDILPPNVAHHSPHSFSIRVYLAGVDESRAFVVIGVRCRFTWTLASPATVTSSVVLQIDRLRTTSAQAQLHALVLFPYFAVGYCSPKKTEWRL